MKVRKPFRTGKTIRDVYQNKLEKRTKSYYEKSVFSRKKNIKNAIYQYFWKLLSSVELYHRILS